MRTIIQNIIINLWVIPIYFFINIRRYINEKKIKQISNNELLKNGFIKFNSDNGTKLAEYLKNVVENPEDADGGLNLKNRLERESAEYELRKAAEGRSPKILSPYPKKSAKAGTGDV